MAKALFLVLHRKDRSPGQRYRHEQYVSLLEEAGIDCTFSPLLDQGGDRIFYGKKNMLSKILVGLKALIKRFKDLQRANQFDLIYIYRDAFFFGTFFEKRFAKKKAKIIYDFDDAIWLMDKNPNQGVFNLLKNPNKTSSIISISDTVIVGNEYLASYARKFSTNVEIIPSTIDFKKYNPTLNNNDKICIGWTGSFSTIKHFEIAIPALKVIKDKYRDKINFKIIGDPSYTNKDLDVKGIKWSSKTEVEDLSELDIGIMPLPDNEWTRGKCAMKGLQYMALEIPTIMSPVGINSDIIKDGENGFLATTTDEWIDKLILLIENVSARKKLGKAGRKIVEKDFSVEANKNKWLQVFQTA